MIPTTISLLYMSIKMYTGIWPQTLRWVFPLKESHLKVCVYGISHRL